MKVRITAQVLNGATGEVREVVANVEASSQQEAVNKLFAHARRDDYYYRFLGHDCVIDPVAQGAVKMTHQKLTYWSREGE